MFDPYIDILNYVNRMSPIPTETFVQTFNTLYTSDSQIRCLANSEDPDEMPHNAIPKMIYRERNTVLFVNYNL